MNWMNLLGLIYLAIHMVAGLVDLLFLGIICDVQRLGSMGWMVPLVCLVLTALNLAGRLPLSGRIGTLAAALALPLLCGAADVLIRDDRTASTPEVWAGVFSLLLLAGYVLLRGRDTGEEALDRAAALLERGSTLGVAEMIWLYLLGAAVFLMATFGFLLTLILGGLFASKNSLLDYSGVRGWLLGILALHLLQSALFWRGTQLARAIDPVLGCRVPLVTLFVPVWNLFQADWLEGRLREYRLRKERQTWAEF